MSEAKIIKIMFNLKKEILNVIISQKNGEKETKVMKRVPSIAFFILILAIQLFPFSQKVPPKKLTVEWLFDEEIQEKFRPPRYTWLDDGSVLLLDYQKAKGIRTLELFDPRMPGERTAAIDRGRVLKAFEKMVGEEAPEEIEWPEAVDPKGQALVYILDDDLYCVQISDSAVKRLTRTEAEETSVTFSPDGKWISFIRDNDIYALDWREESLIRLTSGATETLLNGTLSWVYWEEIYDRTELLSPTPGLLIQKQLPIFKPMILLCPFQPLSILSRPHKKPSGSVIRRPARSIPRCAWELSNLFQRRRPGWTVGCMNT